MIVHCGRGPPRGELDARARRAAREVGEQCEMRSLHDGPADLEDGHERRVVDEFRPMLGAAAAGTTHVDERHRAGHRDCAYRNQTYVNKSISMFRVSLSVNDFILRRSIEFAGLIAKCVK